KRAVLTRMRIEPGHREAGMFDAKTCREGARHDAASLNDEVEVELAWYVRQREMNSHRDHGQFGRPQHHDWLRRDRGQFGGELAEKFSVARLGKAGLVENVLCDRVGDDGGCRTVQDLPDRGTDGSNRDRRARLIWKSRTGRGQNTDIHDRKRSRKGFRSLPR